MSHLKELELDARIQRFLNRKFAEFPELAPESREAIDAAHTKNQLRLRPIIAKL